MKQAAAAKAMGRIDVDEGPARTKVLALNRLLMETKAEAARKKELGLDTGVARAEMGLLRREINTTNRSIAETRLGLRAVAAQSVESGGLFKRFGSGLTEANKSLKTHGEGLKSYGHQMSGLALPIAAVGFESVKMSMDFRAAMERVHGQAGASEAEVKKMTKAVLAMKGTAHSPKELADALFHVESTSIRGAHALDLLKYAAIGANVGNTNLESVTNALVSVLKTAPHDIHGAGQAMGLLNEIVGAGNMRMDELVGAISTGVLPAAKTFGLGMRDVGASLDVMTSRGIPAEQAATRLRMTFSLMAAPSSKAVTALGEVGLTQGKLAKDMRQPNGVLVAMRDLKHHLETSGKSASEQAAIISHAFGGGRTSSGIMTLVQNTKDLATAYHALPVRAEPALKKLEDANAQWEKTSKAHWDNAKANIENSAVRIGTTLTPIVIPVLVKLANAVQTAVGWFSKLSGPVKTGTVAAVALTAVLGPLLIVLGSIAVATSRTITGVKGLASAFGSLQKFGVAGFKRFSAWLVGASATTGAEAGAAESEAHVAGGIGGKFLGRFKRAYSAFKGWLLGASATTGAEAGVAQGEAMAGANGLGSSKVLGKLKSIGKIVGRLVGLGIAGGLLLALPQIVESLNKIGPVISDWAAKNIPGVKALQNSGVVKSIRHATDPAAKAVDSFMGQINPFGKAAGGPIDPGGYGGGDRHVRVLESGEYVLRKEAVAKHGPGFVDALNRGRNPAADGILTAAAVLVDAARSMGAQNPLGSITTLGAKASGSVTVRTGGLFMAAGGLVQGLRGGVGMASGGVVSDGGFAGTAKEAGKAGEDIQKGFGDKLKDTVKQSLETTQKLRKDSGDHFTLLRKGALDDSKLLADGAVQHFKDTHDRGTKETSGLRDDVIARFAQTRKTSGDHGLAIAADVLTHFTAARASAGSATKGLRDDTTARFADAHHAVDVHGAAIETATKTHLRAAQTAGSQLASKLASAIAGSFGSADSAVYTATGYVEQAVDAALKGFGAKAVSFSIPKPKGVSAHATGGIPNPGSGGRDDHLLLDPAGNPVAALSGTEGILNTPQMGVVDRALGLAKAVGGSAFGSLGELWGSGLTHYAKGGALGESPMQRASQLAQMQLPYVWGGHHGDSGPIMDPRPGLDCSSAVSYVLGIPPRVSGAFESYGKPGAGPITLYASPSHIFMSLAGKGFGTGHGPGHNPAGGGGPGWLTYNSMPGFTVRHIDGSPGSAGSTDIPKVTVKGPAGALLSLAQAGVDKARTAGSDYMSKQLAKLNSVSGQPLNEPGGAGPASGWTDQGMALAGVSGGLWKQMLLRQEMRESSYNPNPPNINDINTAQGNPSRGILQTTGSTFKQFMVPGHGNILNPVDNIAAAIRYMIATYGHGNSGAAAQAMWARGGGAYRSGGLLARFAGGGQLGRFGGLTPPRKGQIVPGHYGGSLPSQRQRTIHAHHHALRHSSGHSGSGHVPHASQPHVGPGANHFLGDFQRFGGLPAFLTPNTNQIASEYLQGVGLPTSAEGTDPLTQSLISAGAIPGLTSLDQTDRAIQANSGHFAQLQAQLQAGEPGGQLSQADYQQLEGVAQYGVSALEGEQSTVASEYATVSHRYAQDESLIGRVTGRSDKDKARIATLKALLTKQQRQAQAAKHKLQKKVLDAADHVAGLESKNYDAMQRNAQAQRRIKNEPVPDFAGQSRGIAAGYDRQITALRQQISRLPSGRHKQQLRRKVAQLAADKRNALSGHSGKAKAWHTSQARRLKPLKSEAIRLQHAHHNIASQHSSAERKYHRLGWSKAWAFTRKKWQIQDKIKKLQAEVKGLNDPKGPLAAATSEASQLDAAATTLITRAQALPDQISQAQGQVDQVHLGAVTPQLLTPGQTGTLAGLTEAMALADVSSDPTTGDEKARVGLQGFWQNVLGGLEAEHAPVALITEAAGNLKSFMAQGGAPAAAGGAGAGGPTIAEQVRAQMTSFDDSQRSLFQTFGSNALPSLSGASLGGMRDFGAAGGQAFADAGQGPSGGSGKTVVVQDGGSFVQLNHAPPVSDPHAHAALSRFAFESSFG